MFAVELKNQSQNTTTLTTELTTYEGRTKEWKRIIKRVERWEKKLRGIVVQLFRVQQRVTLKRFSQIYGRKAELRVSEPIFDPQEWVDEWREKFEPFILQVILDSARRYVDNPELGHPSVRAAIGERTRIFSELPNQTTAKKIQRVLREGFEAGKPIPEIADDIRAVFKDATKRRAQLIARTEVMGASNFGAYLGALDGGFPFKMWLTSRDERVRQSHRIDGQVKKIEEPFELADGRKMMYPQDFNERCIVRPLLENPYGQENNISNEAVDFGVTGVRFTDRNDENLISSAIKLLHRYSIFNDSEITSETINAFNSYKNYGYSTINRYLRGQELDVSDNVKKTIETMKNYFKNRANRLDRNVIVYRGIGSYNGGYLGLPEEIWEESPLEEIKKRLAGAQIKDNGFVSTSIDSGVAFRFVKSERVKIVLRMKVPVGTKAVSLEQLDENILYVGEGELLLENGTTIKINDISFQTTKIASGREVDFYLVEAEVI